MYLSILISQVFGLFQLFVIEKKKVPGVPIVTGNLTRNHEVVGSIPSLAQWVKDLELP